MRIACLVTVLAAGAAGGHAQGPALHLPPLDRVLPPGAERVYAAVAPRLDPAVAMETVRFMDGYWRLAGNPGFEASQQFVLDRLRAGGFTATAGGSAAGAWYEEFPNAGMGWEPRRGAVTLAGGAREVVLSQDRERVTLAINSFSTPPGGVELDLVDVGRGTEAGHYEGRDVAGAVVLADGPLGAVWTRAVRERGAAGVISTDLAAYTRPGETPDVLQWGAIPYDEARRSFGFKATPRAARRLRARLAEGAARVHVDIETTFHRRPNRTLVAELAGASRADERVVLVAHVQEPGANDNGSGTGTLLAAALALRRAVAEGALPPPARTLTFLWVDEIRGSEAWLRMHAEAASRVMAMMSLDMTGQDTAKTGGTFLIEKSPDPSAVWPRPSDPHSEWGAGTVDPAWVKGHFLNDLHLAVCLRRARDTGWVVRTNPYEGGSDHTVFTRAGVPALLNWHFTDRYYHTNLDRPDKTSPATMAHVGVAVATTAMFLASAGAADREALTALVDAAEAARAETERRQGASEEILSAWRTWYAEARASVETLR
ncbi:MAG: M28 family peptidase [Acidobacteriota bacterium]